MDAYLIYQLNQAVDRGDKRVKGICSPKLTRSSGLLKC
jgi:hypothetical protein